MLMASMQFRAIVEPILNTVFDGVYDQRADEWKQFVKQREGTKRAYHEEPVMYGFGSAPEMPEGTPVNYDSGGIQYIQRYIYPAYGLAFALTKIAVEDGDHISLGKIFAEHLAQSMIETKETIAANLLNRAFNTSYTGGDGKALVVTDHPIVGGTFSNRLTTDANLSQTSLEQMLIQIRGAVDARGKKVRVTGKKLVVPAAYMFQAKVLLESAGRTGTNNNDKNPLLGELSDGVAVVSRLTSSTAWFVKTDARNGLSLMVRRSMERSMEGDFETDNMRYKATERYGMSWTEYRDIYGTPGV